MDILGIFSNEKYIKMAKERRDYFNKNKPFPHIIIDNFFDKNIAILLEKQFPDYNQSDFWIHRANKNICKKYQFFEIKFKFGISEIFTVSSNSVPPNGNFARIKRARAELENPMQIMNCRHFSPLGHIRFPLMEILSA